MTASSAHPIYLAGGVFTALHRQVIGSLPDLSALGPDGIATPLLSRARAVWRERARTEFRSVQIMIRFLGEVVAAGDPLDVYAGALSLVEDEIRHTELCVAVCRSLGDQATFPDPLPLLESPEFMAAPAAERALASAITMLLVNETLSVGFIGDLARRCRHPGTSAVLDAMNEDESVHQSFGVGYVRASLARCPASSLRDWRHLVTVSLQPHQRSAEEVLAKVPGDRQVLEAWPEQELADLGLLGPTRQALVFRQTLHETLMPRLRELSLAPA